MFVKIEGELINTRDIRGIIPELSYTGREGCRKTRYDIEIHKCRGNYTVYHYDTEKKRRDILENIEDQLEAANELFLLEDD